MQLCAKFYSIPVLNIIAYALALLTFPYIGYVRRRVMKEYMKVGSTGAEVGVWKGEFSKYVLIVCDTKIILRYDACVRGFVSIHVVITM